MCVCVCVFVCLCLHLLGVLHDSEIQVVGPVYADDSIEEGPSLSDMISLFRESLKSSPRSKRDIEDVRPSTRELQQASGIEW